MGLFDALAAVVSVLDAAQVPHMVSGSVASARHGETRATQDIDIVIDPTPEQIDRICDGFRALGWYVGDGRAALDHRSQFNVIDTETGWKIDLVIRRDRPFSREEFGRRVSATIGGVDTWIVTVEDSILSKLEWAVAGGSERQLSDVRSMLAQQGETLDRDYLERWADELGVTALLREAGG